MIMKEIIEKLQALFAKLDILIEETLTKYQDNDNEVNELLDQITLQISKLERLDQEQYAQFKYKYHTTYSNYLKSVGKNDEANEEKKLAEKYKKSNTPSNDSSVKFIVPNESKQEAESPNLSNINDNNNKTSTETSDEIDPELAKNFAILKEVLSPELVQEMIFIFKLSILFLIESL